MDEVHRSNNDIISSSELEIIINKEATITFMKTTLRMLESDLMYEGALISNQGYLKNQLKNALDE